MYVPPPTHTPSYTYTLNKTLKHPADYESSYKDLVRNKIFCVEIRKYESLKVKTKYISRCLRTYNH